MSSKSSIEWTDELPDGRGKHSNHVDFPITFYRYPDIKPKENGEYIVFYRMDSNITHAPNMTIALYANGRWKWDDKDVVCWGQLVDRGECAAMFAYDTSV